MTESDEHFVEFWVVSKTQPLPNISEMLGMVAKRVWKMGDFRPNGKVKHRDHGWVAISSVSPKAEPEEQLDTLLDLLEAKQESVIDLSNRFDCSILFASYIHTNYHFGIDLSHETLDRIVALRLSITSDFHVFGSSLEVLRDSQNDTRK
ncbi:MAG: DUF4279 domain-containing protein [Planctomycetota bacterium]